MMSSQSIQAFATRLSVRALPSVAGNAGFDEIEEIESLYTILKRQPGFQDCDDYNSFILCCSSIGGLIGECFGDTRGLYIGILCGALFGVWKNRNCVTIRDLARRMSTADKLDMLIHVRRIAQIISSRTNLTTG